MNLSVTSPASKNQSAPPKRLLALDGLRGIAILFVVLHHYGFHPSGWVDWGPIAPNIFFLLSGYLITRSLFRLRSAGSPVQLGFWEQMGSFHMRRMVRLLPALYVMLVVGILFGIPYFRETWHWHAFGLTNFHIIHTDEWVGTLSHLWSLAVQEQFYILWPLILLLPARWMPSILISAFFGAALFRLWALQADATDFFRWFMLPASLDPFAMGGLIAWMEKRRGNAAFIPKQWNYPVAALALMCWICARILRFAAYPQMLPIMAFIDTLETLCIAWIFLILISSPSGMIARAFSHPVPVFIGKVSYGIFIWHTLVYIVVAPLLNALGWGKDKPFVHYGVLVLSSIFVAWLSWILIERPASQYMKNAGPVWARMLLTMRRRMGEMRRFISPIRSLW